MTLDDVAPTRTNKNGRTTVDWLAYLRTGWPMAVALALVSFYLGGRLETPAEKQERIDRAIFPILERLDHLPPDLLLSDVQRHELWITDHDRRHRDRREDL